MNAIPPPRFGERVASVRSESETKELRSNAVALTLPNNFARFFRRVLEIELPRKRSPSRVLTSPGFESNTLNVFRFGARNAAADQNETGWSDSLNRYMLATVQLPPALDCAERMALNLTLSPGEKPSGPHLTLRNVALWEWVALDGSPSMAEVWADAASWGTVHIGMLSVDTTYPFQVKARNEDDIETAPSAILAAKTSAPDSMDEEE